MAWVRNSTSEYVKLDQRLNLLAWLNGHFGYENNRDLLADMRCLFLQSSYQQFCGTLLEWGHGYS